jgi:hypothetical protein
MQINFFASSAKNINKFCEKVMSDANLLQRHTILCVFVMSVTLILSARSGTLTAAKLADFQLCRHREKGSVTKLIMSKFLFTNFIRKKVYNNVIYTLLAVQ